MTWFPTKRQKVMRLILRSQLSLISFLNVMRKKSIIKISLLASNATIVLLVAEESATFAFIARNETLQLKGQTDALFAFVTAHLTRPALSWITREWRYELLR
jgi:hypothetical protein